MLADPERIVVSFSELDTGKQCPHKHQLSYKERWTKHKDETSAAGRGTLWHKVMDAHYTALQTEADPQTAAKEAFRSFRLADKPSETIDLLEWMYDGYVQQWGNDREWEVLAVEHKVIVPLPELPPHIQATLPGPKLLFDLKMIIDLIIRDRTTGRVWLIDHKSHAYLPKDKELDLDDQFGLYTWGQRQLGKPVFGAIYNTARTQRNKGDHVGEVAHWDARKAAGDKRLGKRPEPQTLDARFDRHLMSRMSKELDTLALEATATATTLYSPYNFGERHTNTDTCKWRCDFTEACLLGRKQGPTRERQFLRDVGFTQNFTRH